MTRITSVAKSLQAYGIQSMSRYYLRQFFADHVIGSQPMKRKEKMHEVVIFYELTQYQILAFNLFLSVTGSL